MFWVIYALTPQAAYTAVAFFVGSIVSILSGAIGMLIATQANYRTTFCAKRSLSDAFRTAYRAGCGMGFALVSLGLLGIFFCNLSLNHSYQHLQKYDESGRSRCKIRFRATILSYCRIRTWRFICSIVWKSWRWHLYKSCRRWCRFGW